MISEDRVLLLDLENLGATQLRPRPLRARLETLLAAAGTIHHAVAAYARPDTLDGDPLASQLAQLRIAPLRVAPGPDAAELALLAHAHRVHADGIRTFLVGSADGRFAELARLGRVELLVWNEQPVATKLADVVHHVHRLSRPTGAAAEEPVDREQPEPDFPPPGAPIPAPADPRHTGTSHAARLLAAFTTGIGIAAGQRFLDALLTRPRR
ncbi:hypothetical protein [Umezawaea sp. Da 62-37]|uniref:hypothetical protein n=1 Tax=Umezawaea sp. Da 62-37 TaxID=3075927 RepID=UPI0028F71CF9|nr:hypothetical protein [Umezawaea sp. Da 62-37]WNV86687.1 hypothetical protein RM788_52675 [Umezawaea sp. Da 62-37]WNV86730.1 hypothetical protein RM788_00130 [Umezawaea sp. Da 62-37]